ncbi:MAG: metallophosphoesterase [Nitrosopumilaceae archaeon]|uniref:Metallophosphoesterase n=1 Tax=Candidatus Nitrosomaritimum aestuariumsis TaxID=3342354 RepID=A0AC60W930_9ARCH|nr:metallophosphoesterase [Nitrosopumilaceae archaeon]
MLQQRIVSQKPALVIEGQKKYLVVTDLHIGFESSFASNEIFLGKNTSINETIDELLSIIESENPDSVILLGDVKSSIKNISKTEWNDVPLFFEKIKEKCNIILIPGNHDSNIQRLVPEGISLISSTGMVEEEILFTHGHTMPTENFSHVNKIIMGHLHPVFFQEESIVNGQRVWVSMRTNKDSIFPSSSGEIEVTIVPSFNKYFYATNKRKYKKSISPIVEKMKQVSSARIVTLDGTIIGDENILDQVL